MKYTLIGAAALLLGAYAFYELNATGRPIGDMGDMAMNGSPPMNNGSATEGFQAAMNSIMGGMTAPATGYPDVDFANGMIAHHEGAVAMAKVEKQFGKDQLLLTFSDDIIKTQEAEIAFLKEWLDKQDLSILQIVPEANKTNSVSMSSMMKDMAVSYTGNPDVDFANGMIPHHQGAINMARTVLQFGKDAEIRKLEETIITTQGNEISILKDWLAQGAP